LGLPTDLVTELEGRIRSQQEDVSKLWIPSQRERPNS
jgi:hypothetical protein